MFFRSRLNILIFLPILARKRSCWIFLACFVAVKKVCNETPKYLFYNDLSCAVQSNFWAKPHMTHTVFQKCSLIEHTVRRSVAAVADFLAAFVVYGKNNLTTVKLKTYCIVFINFQRKKYYFQNRSREFITLEIFLKFLRFQPLYAY